MDSKRTAVVTGAASGIGAACAQRLASDGLHVVGLDLQEPLDWNPVLASDPQAHFMLVDVTDEGAQRSAVESLQRIDVLVTAAGIGDAGPVHTLEESAWDRVIDINLKGTYLSIRAVLDKMMAQRSGSIITVASVEGINGTEGGSAYNASKGGVVLLSKNVAIDYARMGIRCNAICPGFIQTPMFDGIMDAMPEFKADIEKEIKLGRFGRPEEIASVAAFLASDDASYLTGQAVVVDGGYTAGHSHGVVEMMGLI